MTKKLPAFKSIQEEATFWDTHDVTDYLSELKSVDVTVHLSKPKEETLVVRINKDLKKKLEDVSKTSGITMSSLARMWIIEKLRSI